MSKQNHWNRRAFLSTMTAAGGWLAMQSVQAADAPAKPKLKEKIPLGFDNFSIRGLEWKAPQLLDHAAKLKVDYLFISDLNAYESLEEDYLKTIKAKADKLGIKLHAGSGSICPSSKSFNDKYGTAEEHLATIIRTAKTLGSPVARCFIGSGQDRLGDGGIYRHIENTVKVCKACKNIAQDAGVKIAIENHAGDTQAWELAELFEAAGRDYVGATMDPGNAAWTIEDPLVNLEILGPYAATTGMRDSMVYEVDNGVNVQWCCMGDGITDWTRYVERFQELCPGVPFLLEVIAGVWDRNMAYLTDEFWEAFPRAKAHEFAKYVAWAKKGHPYQAPADRPTGEKSKELEQKQQLYDLERSINYCKNALGLGVKA